LYEGEKEGTLLGLEVKDGKYEGIEDDGDNEGVLLGLVVDVGSLDEIAVG
jgi:hypothetical protein